jgi:crossover junction endodeoxyribonuclease RusA
LTELKLNLQWPPSVNGYWRSFKGRQIISQRGRDYLKYITGLTLMHRLQGFFGSDPVAVTIVMYPKTQRRFDCDNFTKCLFDCFSKCKIWDDDSQIYDLHIIKGEPMKNGFLEVHVKKLVAKKD